MSSFERRLKQYFSGSAEVKDEGAMSVHYLIWLHRVKAKKALSFRDFPGFEKNEEIIENLRLKLKQKTQKKSVPSFFIFKLFLVSAFFVGADLLVIFSKDHQAFTFRAIFSCRFLPHGEFAFRVIVAGIEDSSGFRFLFDNITLATFRTFGSRGFFN